VCDRFASFIFEFSADKQPESWNIFYYGKCKELVNNICCELDAQGTVEEDKIGMN
jgi:hypothetical protein